MFANGLLFGTYFGNLSVTQSIGRVTTRGMQDTSTFSHHARLEVFWITLLANIRAMGRVLYTNYYNVEKT